MISEPPDWSDGETVEADICIVGAGIVGLALAHAFLDARHRVLVLEAGGWQATARGQDDLWAETEGVHYHSFSSSRFRAYGGCGSYWGGVCPSLEQLDFEGVGQTITWPVTVEEMGPWIERAEALLDVRLVGKPLASWEERTGSAPRLGPELRPVVLPLARQPDPGASCRDAFRNSSNVHVALRADVLSIETDATASRAEALRAALPGGRRVRCRARQVVIAAGGVENARLLLLSNDRASAGIGNLHDQVGRWFSDHLYCYPGHLEPAEPLVAKGPHIVEDYAELRKGAKAITAYSVSEATRRREGLNGAAAFFRKVRAHRHHPDRFSPGGTASAYFAEVARGKMFLDRSAPARAYDLLRDAPAAARLYLRRMMQPYRPEHRLSLQMQIEVSPRPDSRVTLAETKDRLGRRRSRVSWQIDKEDFRGADRLWTALARALASRGVGKLVGAPPGAGGRWPTSTTSGKHHMGTTRMSEEPRGGVVDPSCRVHGMENLHIAGSSVFPTGGWANPTLTAIALALRLAARLRA